MIPTTRLPRDADGKPAKLSPLEKRRVLEQMKAETYPRRKQLPLRGKPTKENPQGPLLWPSKVPAAPAPPRKRDRPTGRVVSKDEGRTALEQLSKLAGGTTYRTPEAGRSTQRSGGNDDLAGALGFVTDDLQQRMALALAVHSTVEWRDVEELAAAPLLKQLLGSHKTRNLVMGVKRQRARLVLKEVFFDLAAQRPPRATKESAALLKMTQRDYRLLYQSTAGFLESEAHMGAVDAIEALYHDEK